MHEYSTDSRITTIRNLNSQRLIKYVGHFFLYYSECVQLYSCI